MTNADQQERWQALVGGPANNDWWIVVHPLKPDVKVTVKFHYQADELRDYLNALERQLSTATEALRVAKDRFIQIQQTETNRGREELRDIAGYGMSEAAEALRQLEQEQQG